MERQQQIFRLKGVQLFQARTIQPTWIMWEENAQGEAILVPLSETMPTTLPFTLSFTLREDALAQEVPVFGMFGSSEPQLTSLLGENGVIAEEFYAASPSSAVFTFAIAAGLEEGRHCQRRRFVL